MKKVTFPARAGFHKALRQRVDAYFDEHHLSKNGNWRMFVKTAVILVWLITAYLLLVFFSTSMLMALISAFAVAQGFVLVGFNIMHDGNHGSYSRNKTINRIMGYTADMIGGSSFLWKQKHNILHHTYTNIEELDDDLNSNGLLRLSPDQPWRPWHRFQHLYALPVYSLLTLSWILFSDFKKFFTGKIGSYEISKPSAGDTVLFFLAKLFYFGYTLVLPMFFHPVLYVLIAFVCIHLVFGLTMSVVFQLAHTVEGNTFPQPDPESRTIEQEWAIHEIETTANFAPKSRLAAWYMGGLNFQIEHHLFAKVCHIHYPEISKLVEKTCREFSVSYLSFPSVHAALAAHFRFLRRLGKKRLSLNPV
ncbi:MAG: acyl-CoA desaturase [Calditrichaeota bacterium]|nr:acyl-CoA desaturase [Calditrichota bacterium]MCB0294657.1 acyl-CoA desaturase [Calditrichota bacterium]